MEPTDFNNFEYRKLKIHFNDLKVVVERQKLEGWNPVSDSEWVRAEPCFLIQINPNGIDRIFVLTFERPLKK